jgi:hypothetical protein
VIKIGFLALAQAHQYFHWLPAALELARRPGVSVDVICPSRAGIRFIKQFDADGLLNLVWTPASLRDGLFDVPRGRVIRAYRHIFRRYPVLVTTETTSTRIKDDAKFRGALVRIRHGAGDTATRIDDDRIRLFDLTLANGEKDKRRLIEAGQGTDETIVVAGYAKFELVKPPVRLFANDRPIALYNPHLRPDLSSWFSMGEALVREMERLSDWNFVVAPHVKLKGPPFPRTSAPNILIDRGSIRSIDMTYTRAASVYIGDASSQVYEFLSEPRPCIFVDAHGFDWRDNAKFAHFRLGQVIDRPEALGEALARAPDLQPQYEPLQRTALADSIDSSPIPASVRQADAILLFAQNRLKSGQEG